MTQKIETARDWPSEWAKRMGENIKRQRKAAGFRSAEEFSKACAKMGFDYNRSTIANLENGRKRDVSVADIARLAIVLGVPPVELIFALTSDDLDLLPTAAPRPSFEWALWFSGDIPLQAETPYVTGDHTAENYMYGPFTMEIAAGRYLPVFKEHGRLVTSALSEVKSYAAWQRVIKLEEGGFTAEASAAAGRILHMEPVGLDLSDHRRSMNFHASMSRHMLNLLISLRNCMRTILLISPPPLPAILEDAIGNAPKNIYSAASHLFEQPVPDGFEQIDFFPVDAPFPPSELDDAS